MTRENLQSRILALAILAGAVAAVWLVVVMPVTRLFAAQREEIAQSAQLLGAYQGEIANRAAIEARYAAIDATQASLGVLVRGENAQLAAANMQGLVKTLVEREAGQMRSAQNLASSRKNGFEKVSVQYDMSLPLSRLKDAAYRLETGTPYLFLDDVDIRMPESWQSEGAANDPPPLEVQWTVSGYRWAGAP